MLDNAHANANWKNQNAWLTSPIKKKLALPIKVFSLVDVSPPYANAYPVIQKAMPPPQESKRFHRRTFLTFLLRMDPAHNYGYRGKTKIGLEGNAEPIALLQYITYGLILVKMNEARKRTNREPKGLP